MRDPDLEHLYLEPNDELLIDIPKDLPPFEYEPFNCCYDDREFAAYIKYLKKVIRSSFEYKTQLIPFLREYMGMNQCSYLPNLTNENRNKIRIEIHHDPIDLETICRVVYRKRLAMNESTEIPAVQYEVLWCHYSLLVGLIPLSETVHELVHNGNLFIDPNKTYGFYKQFVDRYYKYFSPEELETLDKISQRALSGDFGDYNTLLQTNHININMNEDATRWAALTEVKNAATAQLTSKQALKSISVSRPLTALFEDPFDVADRHTEAEDIVIEFFNKRRKDGIK